MMQPASAPPPHHFYDQFANAAVHYFYDQFANAAGPERFLSDYQRHVYYPRELELLFRLAGFKVEAVWGDYGQSPLEHRSRVLVMVGMKE